MRAPSIRSLLSGGALALALTAPFAVGAPAAAAPAAFPEYFAGGGTGPTQAAAIAAAQSDVDADIAAHEAETGTTCTTLTRDSGTYQLRPSLWGAYVLQTADCH